MTGHVTAPTAALADQLPSWATLVRAPNPGPMTLDGTNTWVLRAPGAEAAVVVDPGPDDDGHLAALAAHTPIALVLLTHGHADHTEGVAELCRRAGNPAVWSLIRELPHPGGEPVADPAPLLARSGLRFEVLATPGHTADSVCFLVEGAGERAVLTGDTILGRGTTVVAHPDGDLGDYLESLTLLSAYEQVPVLPGHGPALADCAVAARFYLAHRQARLDQVRRAVAAGARTAQEVVAAVYAEVDPALWPAATWSVRAQLAYLDRLGGRAGGDRESGPGAGGLDPA
jgi:glyoxylase-like metal-dependent hydrolase (beta-lactamase superfamily II)